MPATATAAAPAAAAEALTATTAPVASSSIAVENSYKSTGEVSATKAIATLTTAVASSKNNK